MDRRIIPLLIVSLMFFSMCLGSDESKDLETTQKQSTTTSAVSEQTNAEETTTLFVLPTVSSEAPSSTIMHEETTLRTTTTVKATTTTISSSKGCSKCRNSNLTCGETLKDNGTDVICTCIKVLPNGEYSSCYLTRGNICTKCYDGTSCGKINPKGALCRCDELVGEGMYITCFLGKPKCTKCSDGTGCSNVSASGKACFCDPACHGPGCVEWDNCELK